MNRFLRDGGIFLGLMVVVTILGLVFGKGFVLITNLVLALLWLAKTQQVKQ